MNLHTHSIHARSFRKPFLHRKRARPKEYGLLGSLSGAEVDKFEALQLNWMDGECVNAPILTDCPVNIECSVVDSNTLLYHELFVGKIEKVHVDEKYLDTNGRILWDKMELIGKWA